MFATQCELQEHALINATFLHPTLGNLSRPSSFPLFSTTATVALLKHGLKDNLTLIVLGASAQQRVMGTIIV